jgi:hypothetical protein
LAISSSTRKAGPFLGNDATTVFPFAFKVFTSADLRVVRTNALGVESDLVLDTDYTVALNANQDNDPGGTVTRGTALPTGERLTITSDVEALQPLVLTNNGGFYPRVINDAFDKITIIAQQLIEQVGRSLKLPISSSASATLPDPVANRLIAWNSSANGFTNVNPASLATVAAYADANLELFTGNGTQTAFTLAQDPAVLANLDVSISGVTQVGGEDFTWIGTTLTFVVAPPTGTRIQVRYTRAIPPADLAAAVAAAEADRVATAADRVQTGLDVIATAADVVSAEADRVATAADRAQTGLDRVQTGLDRVQTGLDRVQTGLDVATAASILASRQPLDADLTAIAALTSAADKLPYATGAQTWAMVDLTAAGRALLDDADAAAQRTTLGADLATNVSFTPAGANAVPTTVSAKLIAGAASPEEYSGTVSGKLLAALTASQDVVLAKGGSYELAALVNASALQNRRLYLNGATVSAAVGYTGTHLLSISGDTQIIGPGTFNGMNVPAPTGAYASGTYAGTGIYITGTGNDGAIDNVTFTTFQSGPILHDSATTRNGFKVTRCTFTNNQIYTANATNALVSMHGVSYGLQQDCRAATYNWKGFYFANGSFNQIIRCHTAGGVDGHASHFFAASHDSLIGDCTHAGVAGVGFGFKIDDSARATVRNFVARDARSGGMFQGCDDFVGESIAAINPTVAGLFVEGSSTYAAATRGVVSKLKVRRRVLGTGSGDRGVYVSAAAKTSRTVSGATNANPVVVTTSASHGFREGERAYFTGVGGMTELNGNSYRVRNPTSTTFELFSDTGSVNGTAYGTFTSGGTTTCGGEIDRVVIRDSHFENCLWGVHVANSGLQQTNIDILDNEFVNIGQYGILAYMGSGLISRNRFKMDGVAVEACIHAERDGVTTDGILEISGNEFRGCTADNIELETRLQHKAIRVSDNRSDGGTVFLRFNGDGNDADSVGLLEVVNNQGVGLTTGIIATFQLHTVPASTAPTRFRAEGNNFVNTSLVPVGNTLTNTATYVTNLARSQRGTVTLAAGTAAVTFAVQEPNTSYQITLSGGAAETFSWASKTVTGFTINSSNGASTASVDWTISR